MQLRPELGLSTGEAERKAGIFSPKSDITGTGKVCLVGRPRRRSAGVALSGTAVAAQRPEVPGLGTWAEAVVWTGGSLGGAAVAAAARLGDELFEGNVARAVLPIILLFFPFVGFAGDFGVARSHIGSSRGQARRT
jgi:hypothetical protein